MASRTLNRRELRKQADEAERVQTPAEEPAEAEGGTATGKKRAKAAPKAAKKPRKPRQKKGPQRMCAHWGVFDAAMKQVALFDYNQRAAAEQKAADLRAKKAGSIYFLQVVKEPMPEPVAEEVAVG